MLKQKFDSPYVCNDNSTIFFGKFKGQPHSVLKDEENKKYCDWILSTEDTFAQSTKEYIKTHVFA